MSVILLSFPREARGSALGLVGLVISFAPAVGPVLGGLLVDVVGWRALFCISAALGVVVILVAAAVLTFVGGLAMCLYDVGSPLWLVVLANLLLCADMQMIITPVNTWGVNSLDNRLVQHATAVTNTMNQVGASVGTALIMSISALGSSVAAGASDL